MSYWPSLLGQAGWILAKLFFSLFMDRSWGPGIPKNKSKGNIQPYYTAQAVRGPITKINQSKCSTAGPIFSKYRTGHCPEWSRTCVFAVFAFFSRVINFLLTKLARERTGRISALGLFCTDLAALGPYVLSRPRADILPVRPSRLVNKIYILNEQTWSIKNLLYGFRGIFFLRNAARSPERTR